MDKKTLRRKAKIKSKYVPGAEFLIFFCIAVFFETFDYLLLLIPVIGWALVRIIDFAPMIILGLWSIMRFRVFPGKGLTSGLMLEWIPIVGDLLPTWPIFVFLMYLENRGKLPNWLKWILGKTKGIRKKAVARYNK